MKIPEHSSEDAALSRLLRTWPVDAEVPPRFAEGVWRRVARLEMRSEASVLTRWVRLAEMLLRPRFVATYLALLLVAGAGLGFVSGQVRLRGAEGDLKGRYVQSVDPFFASAR